MNTGYLIYQAERTRSAAEQREADATHAELAASLTRLWHGLTAPLRSRRGGRRGARPGTLRATPHQPPNCLIPSSRASR
jgi:hypothetical protein